MKTNSLEETMVKYQDLVTVPVTESKDSLVRLSTVPNRYDSRFIDMEKKFGKRIIVRQSVATLLTKAQQELQKDYPDCSLFVTFGYRTPTIQTQRFLGQLAIEAGKRFWENPIDLYEATHRFVAVPTVAGHPTGGAVDITIIDKKRNPLDFGSKMYDYTTNACYTYFPTLSRKAKENRMVLRNVMTTTGFAPFDGEWWHFSYGDREWAFYYEKPNAIYAQKTETQVKKNTNKR